MISSHVSAIPQDRIEDLARRWKIEELAVFGSALREDFRPDSDLDLLVTFAQGAEWSLLDHVQMQLELEQLVHRPVDLITRRALEQSHNWMLRGEIEKTAQVLYRAPGAAHASR